MPNQTEKERNQWEKAILKSFHTVPVFPVFIIKRETGE